MIPVIGSYYRYVPEDYVALSGIQDFGSWTFAWSCVQSWGGRFLPYYFSFLLIELNEAGIGYFWYYLIFLCTLCFGVYILLKNLLRKSTYQVQSFALINTSIWVVMLLFYSTVGFNESYFWSTASTSYFLQLVFTVLGFALIAIFSIRWYYIVSIYVLFFFSGNASEPFAFILFLILGILFFLLYINRSNYRYRLKTILAIIAVLSGFLFTMLLPGTENRMNAMPEISMFVFSKRTLMAGLDYLLLAIPFQLYYLLPYSILFLFVGIKMRSDTAGKRHSLRSFKWGKTIFTYFILVFISFAPSCFVMGEAGPLRSWHHIGIYTALFILSITFNIGLQYRGRLLSGQVFVYLYLVFCISWSAYIFKRQIDKCTNYSLACDQRIALLNELEERGYTGLLILNPLPDPGFLYKQELSNDRNNYVNLFLKENLKLSFDVAVNAPR